MDTAQLQSLGGQEFRSARAFMRAVEKSGYNGSLSVRRLRGLAELSHSYIRSERISSLDRDWLTADQVSAIEQLAGREFAHRWQLARALARESTQWAHKEDSTINKIYNKDLDRKLEYVQRTFAGFPERR